MTTHYHVLQEVTDGLTGNHKYHWSLSCALEHVAYEADQFPQPGDDTQPHHTERVTLRRCIKEPSACDLWLNDAGPELGTFAEPCDTDGCAAERLGGHGPVPAVATASAAYPAGVATLVTRVDGLVESWFLHASLDRAYERARVVFARRTDVAVVVVCPVDPATMEPISSQVLERITRPT